MCKCGLRIVIIACWFYSFSFSSSSSSCNLIVHLSLCRSLSAQRFNSIVKITHKGFHISVTLFAHTYSHSSSQTIHFHLLNWLREMCREFALIHIILIFIIFFVLAQTNSDKFRPFLTHSLSLSRSSHTHTGPFIPSFTLHGWLVGWLAVWTSPFHFSFFLLVCSSAYYCSEGSEILWIFTYNTAATIGWECERKETNTKKCRWNENTSSPRMLYGVYTIFASL